MPLWMWTTLVLAAPEASETPTVRTEIPLPEGVTSSPVARELVRPRGASVIFAIDDKPELRDGRLVVRGVLANEGKKPATVYVVSAPHTGGPLLLKPRGATFRASAPPEQPPVPVELVLPPGARVTYESALVLDSWSWPDGGAEIEWTFQFWSDPVSGKLKGRLAPPAPGD